VPGLGSPGNTPYTGLTSPGDTNARDLSGRKNPGGNLNPGFPGKIPLAGKMFDSWKISGNSEILARSSRG
jgi:hypothetical protein